MPKYPKNHKDVKYYVPRRKTALTGSTKATSDFLAIIHEDNPNLTIFQLRELLINKYIVSPEALAVLDAHIKAGYGDTIPSWSY